MARKRETFDFEKSLAELESLVERMENSDLSLEDSLKDFERGITLTVPAILAIPHIFLIVPLESKAPIMKRFFEGDVTPELPASIMKARDGARLYLDAGSYSLCEE